MLVQVVAGPLCDKYHNLMSWLKFLQSFVEQIFMHVWASRRARSLALWSLNSDDCGKTAYGQTCLILCCITSLLIQTANANSGLGNKNSIADSRAWQRSSHGFKNSFSIHAISH